MTHDIVRTTFTVAAIAETLYVLVLLTVRWWATQVGRSRFVKAAALAAVLDALAATWWLGWHHPVAWAVLGVLFMGGAVYQLAVLVDERWFRR